MKQIDYEYRRGEFREQFYRRAIWNVAWLSTFLSRRF